MARSKVKRPKPKGFFNRYPNQPIKGFINFKKQLRRKPKVSKEIFDQEGLQFVYLDTPSVSSKHKNPKHVFEIAKSIPRKEFFGKREEDTDYTPNYEIRKKRINLGVTGFDSSTGKDFSSKFSATRNEALYDYDRYKKSNRSMLITRVPVVDFDRNLPRELDPESGLPFFM